MTLLKTCRPCMLISDCDRRRKIQAAIAGNGITQVIHRCPDLSIPYRCGQPVWAHVNDTPHADYSDDDEDDAGPTRRWYPALFWEVAKVNTRGTVIISAGVMPEDGSHVGFKPLRGIGGDTFRKHFAICKVLWSRIKPREGAIEPVCKACGEIPSAMGCAHPYDEPFDRRPMLCLDRPS